MHRYAFGFFVAVLSLVLIPWATAGVTTRVSVASDGTQADRLSDHPSISADGRYVAFESDAGNLVPGDSNARRDIFVHDRRRGETTLVSVAADGTQANCESYAPSLSADGRYVAFESWAWNLVPGDTNDSADVFVHDPQTGHTMRVSVASDSSQANGSSHRSSISADGRFVAFDSGASNLVPNDSNGRSDVFVHDRQTGTTSRVSVRSDGTQAKGGNSYIPRMSADGRYVAFYSEAPNLVPGDTNGCWDVFVHDRQTGQTRRVSVASDGTQGNANSADPSISADGRYVAFDSDASNLVAGDTNGFLDVFVHDRQTGQMTCVSVRSDGGQGNEDSAWPDISADGRHVAFYAEASNLVVGDTNDVWDVFAHDRQTGATSRVSVNSAGRQGNRTSLAPSMSGDGGCVAFESDAGNLVSDDTNRCRDVFVHDRAVRRPDMMIRNAGAAAFRGNDVYNTTGADQRRAQTVPSGAVAIYELKVQNDGSDDDRFKIRGTAGDAEWQVRYFNKLAGGTEITGQVTGAGWTAPWLAPGAKRGLRVEVTPKAGVAAGASKTVLVTASSAADATRKDAVKAVTTVFSGASLAAIGSLSATPTNAGTQITFSLSCSAQVEARILNIAGRPVKTLCQAKDCEAGTNTLLWNAQGDSGLAVPNGTYLVEVLAKAADGAQGRALAPVRVGR